MQIDSVSSISDPISGSVAPRLKAGQNAGAAASVPNDALVKRHGETSSTNVLVEMQKGNILVFKFVDEASGQTIQQIPSAGMLNIAESISEGPASRESHGSKE